MTGPSSDAASPTSHSGKSIRIPDPAFIISLRERTKNRKKDSGTPAVNGGKVADPSYILRLREKSSAAGDGGPYSYNLNDHVGVEEWSQRLKDVITPSSHVIILILGFNNYADKVVTRYLAFQDGMVEEAANNSNNVITVCFDWPARKATRYVADRTSARKSAKLLFPSCIQVLQERVGMPRERIHILTFSMGGFLLQKAFRAKSEEPQVGHVLISQADVAQRDFGRSRWRRRIPKLEQFTSWIQKSLTVYWSAKDVMLHLSSTMRLHARLGARGLPDDTLATRVNKPIDSVSDQEGGNDGFPELPMIDNVGCTNYYRQVYVLQRQTNDKPPSLVDSHEWPFVGNISKEGNGRYVGDRIFLKDVWQVVTDSSTFQYRERRSNKHDQNDGSANNWILTPPRLSR